MPNIADALWPAVDRQDVADVIFPHVREHRYGTPSSGPSPMIAKRHLKGSVDKVIGLAVNEHIDPSILDLCAKDTRVTIRHALLRNPKLNVATRITLTGWAAQRGDDILEHTIGLLSVNDAVTALTPHSSKIRNCQLEDLLVNVLAEPQTAPLAAALGVSHLNAKLAEHALDGKLGTVSITELAAGHPDNARTILRHLLGLRKKLTVEMATLWLATAEALSFNIGGLLGGDEFEHVETGAGEILLGIDGGVGFGVGLRYATDEHALLAAVGNADDTRLNVMVNVMPLRTFPETVQRRIGERLAEVLGEARLPVDQRRLSQLGPIVSTYMANANAVLDDETIFTLALGMRFDNRCYWLGTADPDRVGPRKGMIRRLASDPGVSGQIEQDVHSASRFRDAALDAAGKNPELAEETCALWDDHIGQHLSMRRVTKAAWPVISARLAGFETAPVWETFLTLADGWSGTLTDLLDAVTSLVEPAEVLNACESTADAVGGPITMEVVDTGTGQLTLSW